MSSTYQMDFPGMTRFMDDLKYVMQKGGIGRYLNQKNSGIKSIWDVFVIILQVLTVVLVCYIVFKILFGGYPRILVNLFTWSIYHKDSMDLFLKENKLFLNTYNNLLNRTNACDDAYNTFDSIYKTSLGNQLYTNLKTLQNSIQTGYGEYKYDDQFYEAMKDFYIYYDYANIGVDKDKISIITVLDNKMTENLCKDMTNGMQPGDIKILNKDFYQQLLAVLINKGDYKPIKKSEEQQLIEIYDLDCKNNYKLYKRFVSIKQSMINIGIIIKQITTLISTTPYLAFLIIPDNTKDFQAFNKDFQTYKDIINTQAIYDKNSKDLQEYSWYMIEYLQYKRNNESYNEIKKRLDQTQYNIKEVNTIKKYLNIKDQQKQLAESRIFNRKLEKKELGGITDVSRWTQTDINNEELYDETERCSSNFFEFVKKHPIFSHIMFSDDISNDKEQFYKNVMKLYDRFATSCDTSDDYVKNLSINALSIKQTINAMLLFDVYANLYQPMITKTYQDQNITVEMFFKRLVTPYFEDFIKNRMGTYSKRTFSKQNFKKSYNNFVKQWTKLGEMIKGIMRSITESFKASTGVEEPTVPKES